MCFRILSIFLAFSFYSLVAHSQSGKAMTAFPEGLYSGTIIQASKVIGTMNLFAKDDQLSFETTGLSGGHGIGILVLKFSPDGTCIEDKGKRSGYKGTCIDNVVKLNWEVTAHYIVETEYVWNGDVLSIVTVIKNTENGIEEKSESSATLTKVRNKTN